MTDFPELQHALVDAARRRYGRAPRTWRVARPVLVAAACAAAVAAVVALTGTRTPDERVATPAVTPAPTELERVYAVFGRAATPADQLPPAVVEESLSFGREYRELDYNATRLVVQEGRWRVFLGPTTMSGYPAACVFPLFDGKDAIRGGCHVADPRIGGSSVHDYSFAPRDGKPGAFIAVVRNGIEEVTLRFDDGSAMRVPVRDNVAFFTPLKRWPLTIEWQEPEGRPWSQPTMPVPRELETPEFTIPPERVWDRGASDEQPPGR